MRPLLIFTGSVLLSLLATFPIYTRLGAWAADESDWPETISHLAATRLTIQSGSFPLWNPYICGGSPSLANPQSYYLTFALPLSFLVGDTVAAKLAITLGLALGFLGMLFLGRTLGLSGFPAALTAAVFTLSGFTTAHLANGQLLWLTLNWVPWIVAGYLRSLSSSRWWTLLSAGFLALTFTEGRVYLVAYVALFLTGLALILAIQQRRLRPLGYLLLAGFLTVGLSAWKLFPALAFLRDTEISLPNTDGFPLEALNEVFLRRDVTPNVDDLFSGGRQIARHEYAAYVGAIPLLLVPLSLLRRTRATALPFLLVGVFFLLLAMQRAETSPFEYLPFLRELRNPSRMVSMTVFSIAILSGLGLSNLTAGLARWRSLVTIVPAAITIIVLADLLVLNVSTFRKVFVFPAATETYAEPHFFQSRLPERQPANGYPTIAAGKGAKDFCPVVLRAYRRSSTVRAREDANYRGEVFARGEARTELTTFSPNQLNLHVKTATDDLVLVNQTYDRGWSAGSFPVENADGLLAVRVPAGVHDLRLKYRPPGLLIGSLITLGTFALLALLWLRHHAR